MRERWKMNAMRSGLVVLGALSFGYLTLHLGFRPFLERAQQTLDLELQKQHQIDLENQKHHQQQQQPLDFPESSSSSSD